MRSRRRWARRCSWRPIDAQGSGRRRALGRRIAERLVLAVRALFGGSLEVAITGSAPIAADVLDFCACGVRILEG